MALAPRYTFTVHERLKREQHIKTLFRNGKAFSSFPLKCLRLLHPRNQEPSPVRIAFAAPRKKTPHATDRNRIKRLMREAWRLHKHLLYEQVPATHQWHLFLIYTGPPKPELLQIEKGILQLIQHIADQKLNPDALAGQ